MPQVTLKRGDTTPEFTATLEAPGGGRIDLNGDESIRFYMEEESSGDLIVNQPVTNVDESQSEVSYDFSVGETSRQGVHHAEVVVTFGDGEVRTFPQNGYYEISINPPVNRDVPLADTDPGDATVTTLSVKEVIVEDSGTTPVDPGEVRQNAGDVEVFSGGAVRNLSNIGAEFELDVTTVTTDHTAADNEVVLVDASGGAVTVTLPAPSAGEEVIVKAIDATNGITIATPGSQTIDGQSSLTLSTQYVARSLASDGSDYFIL